MAWRPATILTATNVSARELYEQGIDLMRAGDRRAAYELFLLAYHSSEELTPFQRQQLQEKIRACAPGRDVQQVNGFLQAPAPREELTLQPKVLDAAVRLHTANFDRTREEVTNTIFHLVSEEWLYISRTMNIMVSDLPEPWVCQMMPLRSRGLLPSSSRFTASFTARNC